MSERKKFFIGQYECTAARSGEVWELYHARYEGTFVYGVLCRVDIKAFSRNGVVTNTSRDMGDVLLSLRDVVSKIRNSTGQMFTLPDYISVIKEVGRKCSVIAFFAEETILSLWPSRSPINSLDELYTTANALDLLHASGVGCGCINPSFVYAGQKLLFGCPMFPIHLEEGKSWEGWDLAGAPQRILDDRKAIVVLALDLMSGVRDAGGFDVRKSQFVTYYNRYQDILNAVNNKEIYCRDLVKIAGDMWRSKNIRNVTVTKRNRDSNFALLVIGVVFFALFIALFLYIAYLLL